MLRSSSEELLRTSNYKNEESEDSRIVDIYIRIAVLINYIPANNISLTSGFVKALMKFILIEKSKFSDEGGGEERERERIIEIISKRPFLFIKVVSKMLK